jgi:hypothetical protein
MVIPFSYTAKNLMARKLTTALTAAGMALVVFVFATVLMLQEGLKKTLVDTGSPDNVGNGSAKWHRPGAGRGCGKSAGNCLRPGWPSAGIEGNGRADHAAEA